MTFTTAREAASTNQRLISQAENKNVGTDDFGVQLGALHVGLGDRMGIDGGGIGRSGVWIRVVASVNKFRGSDEAGW